MNENNQIDRYYVPVNYSNLIKYIPRDSHNKIIYSSLCEIIHAFMYVTKELPTPWKSHVILTNNDIMFFDMNGLPTKISLGYLAWNRTNKDFRTKLIDTFYYHFKFLRDPKFEEERGFYRRVSQFRNFIAPYAQDKKYYNMILNRIRDRKNELKQFEKTKEKLQIKLEKMKKEKKKKKLLDRIKSVDNAIRIVNQDIEKLEKNKERF